MKYIVTHSFYDLQDDGRYYKVGDEYQGDRVDELASDNNVTGQSLIKGVKDMARLVHRDNKDKPEPDVVEVAVDATEQDLNQLTVKELKALASERGIELQTGLKKAEIIETIKQAD